MTSLKDLHTPNVFHLYIAVVSTQFCHGFMSNNCAVMMSLQSSINLFPRVGKFYYGS